MPLPVVVVPSGGLRVSVAPPGRGLPVQVAGNGIGIAVTLGPGGLPVSNLAGGPNTPANTTPPVISGDTYADGVLTSTPGAWTNSPTAIFYVWRRTPPGGAEVTIPGATSNTYTVQLADAGATIRCFVFAANFDGAGVGVFSNPLPIDAAHAIHTATLNDAANNTVYSGGVWSGVNFGPTGANRKVVVFLGARSGAATAGATSVTIGGVPATRLDAIRSDGDRNKAEAWGAMVPTGASGNIVVTWPSQQNRCGAVVYSVYGGGHTTFTTYTAAADAAVLPIVIPDKGVAIGYSYGQGNGLSALWVGLTETVDTVIEVGNQQSSAMLDLTGPGGSNPASVGWSPSPGSVATVAIAWGSATVGGNFNPASLAPSLWLEADDALTLFGDVAGTGLAPAGAPVGKWADKSGNAFHVTAVADDATRPIRGAGPIAHVLFDGADDMLRREASLGLYAAGAFTIYALLKSAGAVSRVLVAEGSGASPTPIASFIRTEPAGAANGHVQFRDDTITFICQGVVMPAVFNDSWRVYGLVWDGTNLTAYLDGAAGTPLALPTGSAMTLNRFSIGALLRTAASGFFPAGVAELITVNRAISDAERNDLTTYLASKAGA